MEGKKPTAIEEFTNAMLAFANATQELAKEIRVGNIALSEFNTSLKEPHIDTSKWLVCECCVRKTEDVKPYRGSERETYNLCDVCSRISRV